MGKYGKTFFICIIIVMISLLILDLTRSYIPLCFAIIAGGLAAAILYFLPAITASERNHRNAGAIGILNIFTGWTFLGWVICLVWAATNDIEEEPKATNTINKSDKYDDLKKLQELKDNGTITDEEFEKEKAKILN